MSPVPSRAGDATAPSPHVPRWVIALDLLALVLLVLAVRSLFTDHYRITVTSGIRLSLGSSLRLFLWLTGVLVVRHLAWRAVPWHARLGRHLLAFRRWEPAGAAWPVFVVSRITVLLVGFVAVWGIGFPQRYTPFLGNDLLDLYTRWDAGWYFNIASLGYPSRFTPTAHSSIAFFPGLPLLMRAVAVLLDINLWVAGIIVVTIAFFWGLTYLYRLGREDLTADQARAALMFLAFYPFAVCYSAVLTESLFLLTAAGAFYHFRRNELLRAGVFALATGVIRPNGFLLCLPLGLLAIIPALRNRHAVRWAPLLAQLATAALPIVGTAAYAMYVNGLTGDPFAWMKAQEAWGRGPTEGLNVWEARRLLIEERGVVAYLRAYTIEVVEGLAALFAFIAVFPIVRRFGLAYGVFVAMTLVTPLLTFGTVSLGRYTAPLFPIFLWLGAAVPPPHRPYWMAAFASGQAIVAALFYTWRPPF